GHAPPPGIERPTPPSPGTRAAGRYPRSGWWKGAGGLGSSQAILHRILYWTGGHPYLTQRLCQAAAEELRINPQSAIPNPQWVDRLCAALFLSLQGQAQDDNLLFVRGRLLRSQTDRAGLLHLYAQVLQGRRVPADDTHPLVSVLRL